MASSARFDQNTRFMVALLCFFGKNADSNSLGRGRWHFAIQQVNRAEERRGKLAKELPRNRQSAREHPFSGQCERLRSCRRVGPPRADNCQKDRWQSDEAPCPRWSNRQRR